MEPRICSVHGCGKSRKTGNYCSMHAERLRIFGSLEPEHINLRIKLRNRPAIEKIMDRIEIVTESGCWIYTGPGVTHGDINIRGLGRPSKVHRVVWEHYIGPIPKGYLVCHKCDVGFCCNPNHLFIGTQQDNMSDKVKKNRQAKGSKIGNSLLLEHQVVEILKSRETHATLADKYGVTKRAIKAIKTRQNWGHLSDVEVWRRGPPSKGWPNGLQQKRATA